MKFISPILDKLSHNQSILVFDCEFWHVFNEVKGMKMFNNECFFTPREIGGFVLEKDKEWKIKEKFFVTFDEPFDDVALPISKFASVNIESAARLDEIETKIDIDWVDAHRSILNENQSKLLEKALEIYKKDPNIKKHHKPISWLKEFLELYASSTIIVKGTGDIDALRNICKINGYEFKKAKYGIDIAKWNKQFRRLCGSAQLFDNYQCIEHRLPSEIKQFIPHLELKEAHDPRTDASMTLIICMFIHR
jgi:hypothetical protein